MRNIYYKDEKGMKGKYIGSGVVSFVLFLSVYHDSSLEEIINDYKVILLFTTWWIAMLFYYLIRENKKFKKFVQKREQIIQYGKTVAGEIIGSKHTHSRHVHEYYLKVSCIHPDGNTVELLSPALAFKPERVISDKVTIHFYQGDFYIDGLVVVGEQNPIIKTKYFAYGYVSEKLPVKHWIHLVLATVALVLSFVGFLAYLPILDKHINIVILAAVGMSILYYCFCLYTYSFHTKRKKSMQFRTMVMRDGIKLYGSIGGFEKKNTF